MHTMSQPSKFNEERRDEIMRTAAVLFDRLGYHETSMEEIAREIGLKKPTLYHYVSSKNEIVYWIHNKLHTEYQHRLQARLNDEVPPAQNLLEAMHDVFDILDRYPGHLRVYFENLRNLPLKYRRAIIHERDQYFAMVKSVVIDGIKRGELRETDPQLTTLALFGMCNWSYQWYDANGPMHARDIAHHLWDLFMRGAASPEWLVANKSVMRTGSDHSPASKPSQSHARPGKSRYRGSDAPVRQRGKA